MNSSVDLKIYYLSYGKLPGRIKMPFSRITFSAVGDMDWHPPCFLRPYAWMLTYYLLNTLRPLFVSFDIIITARHNPHNTTFTKLKISLSKPTCCSGVLPSSGGCIPNTRSYRIWYL